MKVNKLGIETMHHFEGCKLTAYQCPAKVWTIGWGNTYYPDKTPVKEVQKSTLLKKININPNDETIAGEFAKWNKAGGKVLLGLVRRRKSESDLYFKK
jgi:lysozyme